jgi:hypothetical protein
MGLSRVASRLPVLLAVALTGGMGTTVMAQGTPDSRVALSVTGGVQTSVTSFTQTVTFELNSEQGSITSTYAVRRRPVVDAGLTVRIWRTFGVGISGSSFHDSGSAEVNGLLPHPFVFNQPRPISGPASSSHSETQIHVDAVYWLQPNNRLEILVSGGPSVFRAQQDFVSDVAFTETDPFDTATFTGATVVRQQKTVVGANLGGEVGWRVARHLGLGGAVRFSRGTAVFPGTSAQAVPVGGLHVGAGLRLLF